jgi:hypothetical protein
MENELGSGMVCAAFLMWSDDIRRGLRCRSSPA